MTTRRGLLHGLAATALLPHHAWADNGPRIVAFGDSLTQGYGLSPQQGLVPVLRQWLSDRETPARIVNHGLSGDTTYGGRVRIHWALRNGADAVIVELGGNDMLLGWPAARAEANLDAILTVATRNARPVLLVGIDTPDAGEEWRAIWPRLARRHGTLLLPDLYAPLAQVPPDQRAPYLLQDNVHPSAKGVELLVDHLGPQVQALIAQVGQAN